MRYNPLAWQKSLEQSFPTDSPAVGREQVPAVPVLDLGYTSQAHLAQQAASQPLLQQPAIVTGSGYAEIGSTAAPFGSLTVPAPLCSTQAQPQQQSAPPKQAYVPPHLRQQQAAVAQQTSVTLQEHGHQQQQVQAPLQVLQAQQQQQLPPHLQHIQESQVAQQLPPSLQHLQQQVQVAQQSGQQQASRPLPGIAGILDAARARFNTPPPIQQSVQQQQQQVKPAVPPGMLPLGVAQQQQPAAAAITAVSSTTAAADTRPLSKPRAPPPGFSVATAAVPATLPCSAQEAAAGVRAVAEQQLPADSTLAAAPQATVQVQAAPGVPPAAAAAAGSNVDGTVVATEQAAGAAGTGTSHVSASSLQRSSAAAAAPAAPAGVPSDQQQQPVTPAVYAPARPRLTLQSVLDQLQHEASSRPAAAAAAGSHGAEFNVREALKWLAAYAPDASALLHQDKNLKQYLKFVLDKHGSDVLACVLFFTFGHHNAFRGVTHGLTLATAEAPIKVLNQRVSYYRFLFDPELSRKEVRAMAKDKTAVMASLLVHRPDVCCQFGHSSLVAIFDKEVQAQPARTTLAALMLLPYGWQQVATPTAKDWLASYVTAVLRDPRNADTMVAYLEKRLAAFTPAEAAAAKCSSSSSKPTPAGAVGPASRVSSLQPSNNHNSSSSIAADRVQQQLKSATAPPAAAAADGQSSSTPGTSRRSSFDKGSSFADLLKQQQQQQPPAGGSPAPTAAAAAADGSNPSSSRNSFDKGSSFAGLLKHQQQQQSPALSSSPASSSWAHKLQQAAAASADSTPEKQQGKGSSSSKHSSRQASLGVVDGMQLRSNDGTGSTAGATEVSSSSRSSTAGTDVIELALVQLRHDRPDVVRFATKELRDRIQAMPEAAALSAIGALWELPEDWAKGAKSPTDHLAAVVLRAAAHAEDGVQDSADEWITLGDRNNSVTNSVTSGRPQGSNKAKAKGSSVQAAWAQLQKDRSDIMKHVLDNHRALISPLLQQQQLQVLDMLQRVKSSSIQKASDPSGMIFALIANAVRMMTQPAPKELQAAFSSLASAQPSIMPYLDDGCYSRIRALPLNKALHAVDALRTTEYEPGWEARCEKPSAWLMGIITRALKEKYGR